MGEYSDGFPSGGGEASASLLAHRGGSHARPVKVRRTGRHTRAARLAVFPVVMILTFALSAAIMIAKPGKAHASSQPKRLAAFYWARAQAGHAYVYGGTGPGFDCSGLVMEAYRHAGISLPRTTFAMLADVASGKLIPEPLSRARKGDPVFYGSGHVELFVRRGHTFGAHDSSKPVGWIAYGFSWVPTMAFRVRGAG